MPFILRWLDANQGRVCTDPTTATAAAAAKTTTATSPSSSRLTAPIIKFHIVYITEAHASDTWPMKFSIEWPRPTTLAQRVEYARTCVADLQATRMGLLVDCMDDGFNTAFGAWPTGYFVLAGTRLLYVGMPQPDAATYDVRLLFSCLDALLEP